MKRSKMVKAELLTGVMNCLAKAVCDPSLIPSIELPTDDGPEISDMAYLELADLELRELDFSLDDLDFIPASTVPKTSESGARLETVSGTKPISIRLHKRVIRAFKAQAAATGTKYQTLMHRALSDAADGFAL